MDDFWLRPPLTFKAKSNFCIRIYDRRAAIINTGCKFCRINHVKKVSLDTYLLMVIYYKDEAMFKTISKILNFNEYDFIVINNEVETAFNNVKSILYSERLRRFRQIESKLNLN